MRVRFERFSDLGDTSGIKEYWRSVGWEEIPVEEEPAIRAAWIAHLQRGHEVVAPKPYRTWKGNALAWHRQEPELEVEFTLKLLAAFRRCTRPEERLWVIDWQHTWYYFDPHGGITVATRDQWAKPVLPDGDSYNYVATDFRFGVVTGWRETGPVTLFGAELLAAFAADPPERFMRVCGPGEQENG
jgi:uncharacterized protein DUF2716